MANLKDNVAIVTGGSSGIGKAIAERFAKDGAHVVIAGRKEGPLQEVAATDEKIRYVTGDVTKTETIEGLFFALADVMTIYHDGRVVVRFRDGVEIEPSPISSSKTA